MMTSTKLLAPFRKRLKHKPHSPGILPGGFFFKCDNSLAVVYVPVIFRLGFHSLHCSPGRRHVTAPYWIDKNNPNLEFPAAELALDEPNGLLAVGGDLSPARLIQAYLQGLFPWFSDDQPILWWSPSPRAVLFPDQLHISRSLQKTIRSHQFRISLDQDFEAVVKHCAMPRQDESGTWITAEMQTAYIELHHMGIAHSVEAWQDDILVGGLYGIALGQVFFGESMFSLKNNASKVAFVHLVRQLQQWHYALIDCQVSSEHLKTLGATDISRDRFLKLLDKHACVRNEPQHWRFDDHFTVLGSEPA